MELLGDDHEISDTTQWIDLVDGEGLYHINDSIFMVFHALEEGLRNISKSQQLVVGAKKKVTTCLLTDKHVQFYWSIVSADFEEAATKTLLKMVIDLWDYNPGLNVRAFIHATSLQSCAQTPPPSHEERGLVTIKQFLVVPSQQS